MFTRKVLVALRPKHQCRRLDRTVSPGEIRQRSLIARAHAHNKLANFLTLETLPHVRPKTGVQAFTSRKKCAQRTIEDSLRQMAQRETIPTEPPKNRNLPGGWLIPLNERVHHN